MKLTDWLVGRLGSDKIMHFLLGALIVAWSAYFGWWGVLIGIIFTFIVSYIKELWLDNVFDWYDIFAAMFGGSCSVIIYSIFVWLC